MLSDMDEQDAGDDTDVTGANAVFGRTKAALRLIGTSLALLKSWSYLFL